MTREPTQSGDRSPMEIEIIEPDEAPVTLLRCVRDGKEVAMIPWEDAVEIASTVEEHRNQSYAGGDDGE